MRQKARLSFVYSKCYSAGRYISYKPMANNEELDTDNGKQER